MMPAPHPKKHLCLFQLLFVTAFPVAWRVFENSNFRAVYCYSVSNKKTKRSKLRQSPLCYCKASEQVTVFLFPVTKAVPTQQWFPCGEGTELRAGVSTMLRQFSSAERHRQLLPFYASYWWNCSLASLRETHQPCDRPTYRAPAETYWELCATTHGAEEKPLPEGPSAPSVTIIY